MNYNKIGEFIMAERKAKKLTQAKLAEKLFVSEKTISKWEHGKGLPDTNILPKLCEIFGISINELLNGERISSENYVIKAEEALLTLQQSKADSDKRLLNAEIVLGGITTISFVLIFLASLYAIFELNLLVVPIISIVIAVAIFIVGTTFCLYIEQRAGYYLCKKCNHTHAPSFRQILFSPHINRTRYMKCPHCKQRSWQKKTIK